MHLKDKGGVKILEKRRLGVHQLLDLTKTLKNATQTVHHRCHSQNLLSLVWLEIKQVAGRPGTAGCREGERSGGDERILSEALKLKIQSQLPLGTESEPHHCHGACLVAGFTGGDRVAGSLTLYREMRALPVERGSGCACGMSRNTEEH